MNKPDISGIHRVRELLQWAIGELERASIGTARLDAEVLLAHAMRRDRLQLYLAFEEAASEELELCYRSLVAKRAAYMPVSYLTGHKEFMSLDFLVNEDVLIPRPETEILVETVCRLGKAGDQVLDLGTGSGAIAVSLAKYNPDWHIVATDLSIAALRVARGNAQRNGVADRISFAQVDLFKALSLSCRFDWVVSNPPYIPEGDLAQLPADVREYEPMLALNGGADGLAVIRHITGEAHTILKPGGRLAIEMGYGQSAQVRSMVNETKRYLDCFTVEDCSGIPRILCCNLRDND